MVEKIPADICTDNHYYTFTINPDDKHQYQNSPTRLAQVTQDVRDLLYKQLFNRYEYELYTEVSHPEKGQESHIARVHYHGWIKLLPEKRAGFYIEHFHKLCAWSRIEIDTIKDSSWLDYCTKDEKEMEPYCRECKVPYVLRHTDLAKPHHPTNKVTKKEFFDTRSSMVRG